MCQNLLANLLKKSAVISYFLLTSVNNYAAFIDEQLAYSHVKQAYTEKFNLISQELSKLPVEISDFEIMLKAYKYEESLKVFVRKKKMDEWQLLKTYNFCASSGTLGPKVKEWDMQIPEGYYHINHFNPYSSFFLSLGVSYPNMADKLKRPAVRKGDGIYIHGGCATIGCIPLTDEPIKELYLLCAIAKSNGQTEIPIHILPFEFSETKFDSAIKLFPQHQKFWESLRTIEEKFNLTFVQPTVNINTTGDYVLVENLP